MGKKLLATLTVAAAVLSSAATSHAQQAAPNKPQHGLVRLLAHLRPEVQAILAKQIHSRSGAAAKPTETETLIAQTSTYGTGSDMEHDSTVYRYSGARSSNLNSSLYSYLDTYNPVNSLSNGMYEQDAPTLMYDTSKNYGFDGMIAFMSGWTNRTYDAANNVTGMVYKAYDQSSALAYQSYLNLSYNAGNQLTVAQQHTDTSAAVSGLYQLSRMLSAVYTGGLRTSDTTDDWYQDYHGRSATTYSYDGAGRMTMQQYAGYDELSETWQDGPRTVYSYDAMDRITNVQRAFWTGTDWLITSQDTFGYTGTSGNFTFNESRYFNDNGTTMDTSIERMTTTLNANGAWDSVYAYSNENGTGSGVGPLIFTGAYELQYNSNDHLTMYQGANFDLSTGIWIPGMARFYYEPIGSTGIASIRTMTAAFAALYPNPAGNQTTVHIANPQGRMSIAVTNLAGQVVYQQSSPAAASIPLNTAILPAGAYQVTVTMNGATQTLKLVRE